MPQMANLTVKNSANVDVTYVALTPSSGDTTQSQWRATGLAAIPAHAPALAIKTQYNGTRDGRRVIVNGVFPVLAEVGGVQTVVARQPFSFETTVPLNIPLASASDHATLAANLLKTALVQSIIAEGYNAS